MSVSVRDVEKMADLARLKINEDEKERMTGQLNMILKYMEKLNEVDTSKIAPLAHTQEIVNVFRDDEVKPSLPVEQALENAPERMDNYFKVPKVIGK